MAKYKGYNPKREELYSIKEDTGPGAHQGEVVKGTHSTMDLTKTALGHPVVRYKEYLIETDVYQMGDELMVHMYCPKCRHAIRISSNRKAISYDQPSDRLSVEPFMCTWELGLDHQEFGFSLCRWTVGIDNGLAKDA